MTKQSRLLKPSKLVRAVRIALAHAAARRNLLGAVSLAMGATSGQLHAQQLPTPCTAGACGTNVTSFSNGAATASVAGNTLTVNQTQNNAVLHWQHFNISADGIVNFQQPTNLSVALNRIYQNDPSRILGSLNANGRVYLLNQNGFVFGQNSRINVGGLIASSLNLSQAAVENGIAQAIDARQAAFQRFTENNGITGGIEVQRGAEISTTEGGQIFMFAPEIVNHGTLRAPGGQTILAAGSSVYLATSENPNLRGMLVEVGLDGGTVTNGDAQSNLGVTDPAQLVGQIIAERGNVTLAGLAVNQNGRVSATTTVRENGTIRLQAREGGGATLTQPVRLDTTGSVGGQLSLGAGSVTEIALAGDELAVDSTDQLRSTVTLEGHTVAIQSDARVAAQAGQIGITARRSLQGAIQGTANDNSRIYIGAGAVLDVSGAQVDLAMERNVVSAELRGDELADSPAQRNGELRGQTVNVDIRQSGTHADGTPWQGTPVGDVSGQIALIERGVAERNLLGGSVVLQSQGDVILAAGSTIDLSGGSLSYRSGFIDSSILLGADGRAYDIAMADPDRVYTGIASSVVTITNDRWGASRQFIGIGGRGSFEPGYVEGRDAGTLRLISPTAILDGSIRADVQVGRHQRQLASTLAVGQIRPYDQIPLGGAFRFGLAPSGGGNDRVGGNVEFGGGVALPANFDPLNDSLPIGTATRLRSELFGEDRIARITVDANGNITAPTDFALRLPAQGELTVTGGSIDWSGDIFAPSGTVNLLARDTASVAVGDIGIHFGGSASIDVSGQWVNDAPIRNLGSGVLMPLSIEGGSVRLVASDGPLALDAGSAIDVSGGGWISGDGRFNAGDAGDVTLAASGFVLPSLGSAVSLQLGASLRGYGFDTGGSLSISAPEICIAGNGNCGFTASTVLTLTPDQLVSAGFGEIELASNERGLSVDSGTTLLLRQHNRWLNPNASSIASGASLDSVSSVVLLPDYLRAPTNLSLSTAVVVRDAAGTELTADNQNFGTVPNLSIGNGARIEADPLARLALRSNSRILVDGALIAHGGEVNLLLDNSLQITEVLSSQGIWLGANAHLDVAGITRLSPNALQLRQGVVLDGGTVNLSAQRGAVITNPGSEIDISGTTDSLHIPSASGYGLATPMVDVSSNGGALTIEAADSILLSGQVAATGGDDPASLGGSLSMTLNANQRYGNDPTRALPVDSRRIIVTESQSRIALALGAALPSQFTNQAVLSIDAIEAAGFDSLRLAANTSQGIAATNGPIVTAPGSIDFVGDVHLSLPRALVLDSARVTGNGNVELNAAYVSIGHGDRSRQQAPAPTVTGIGILNVGGAFVELVGAAAIDGFGSVRLASSGDIRLRGLVGTESTAPAGSLFTNANLTLSADQVYASTLSSFEIGVSNNPNGVLRIESTGGERDTLLSAASQLTLSAPTIEQAGVLRAPFGRIDLNGNVVRLEANSLTSTSAEGAIIPFGSIQAGTDWVYQLPNIGENAVGRTLLVGDTMNIPEQRVALNGDRIDVAPTATIDVSGGGDLLAYEFLPGTTGTQDVLSLAERPGRFAIVPSLRLSQAPHDPQIAAGSTLGVGDSIRITADVQGLPAGDYVLLPARYALLEGAYLVEAAEGYTDLLPGTVLAQLDGTNVVSGFRRIANTSFMDTRSSGFVLTSAAQLAQEARYETARGGEFFAAQAQQNQTTTPRLPQDAGILSIAALTQLDIQGSLRAQPLQGGRGAAVDISAQNLLVSDSATGGNGQVVVSARQISSLGAESILIGGSRSSTDAGVVIATAADTVIVDRGTTLTAPELILSANQTVQMSAGAALAASGSVVPVADDYIVDGDGALLRLAAGEQSAITRNGETGTRGTLVIEEAATLTANGGALALDASLDTQFEGTLALNSGSLSVGASRIHLGDAPQGANGLELDVAELNLLDLDELVLVSRSSFDVHGNVALSVNDVAFDGAGFRAIGNDNDSVTAARSIALSNRDNRVDTSLISSGGGLVLNADEIVIGEGIQHISGYQSLTLDAMSTIRGEQQGGLTVEGDLSLRTPVVLAGRAAETSLTASGAVTAMMPQGGAVAAAQQSALGGSIELRGGSVTLATRIEAAAGSVSVTATAGDLALASGSIIDVAGRSREFDGSVVAARGGNVNLVATQGNVAVESGSLVDVAAVVDGEAGRLSISAVTGAVSVSGELRGSSQSASDSGRVAIDARDLGDVSGLNTVLNAGGFTAERQLRQRGIGDVVIAAGDTLRAERAVMTADQGSVIVEGVIDARAWNGGDVLLSASDSVIVNGSIDASATTDSGHGGELDLRAEAGGARIGTGANVDLSAGALSDVGGELRIRVSQAALTDVDASNDSALSGVLSGVERTTLEAYRRYTDDELGLSNGVLTSAQAAANDTNVLFRDARDFIDTHGAAVTAALGRSGDTAFRLLPGIEIDSDGDLSLGRLNDPQTFAGWDLSSWRFGPAAVAGVLTLRAAGNLTFNRSLSDGFTGIAGTTANADAFRLTTTANSWSYRLIAGADLSGSHLMATADGAAHLTVVRGTAPTNTASPGIYRMVRTGTGSIDIATSGNLVMENEQSVIYTAGRASAEGFLLGNNVSGLGQKTYPVDGGDISIVVGGNIVGSHSRQFVNDWLWRTGRAPTEAPNGSATGWTVNFARFQQGVGALGGGDVDVNARGDIRGFSAVIPSIGIQVGGTAASSSQVRIAGGGNLSIEAGGNLDGGTYYLGRGLGRLFASGDVDTAELQVSNGSVALYPILGLGDGEWRIAGRGSVGIEALVNPTLLPQGASQVGLNNSSNHSFFSTYASTSSLHAMSIAGDLEVSNNVDGIAAAFSRYFVASQLGDANALRYFATSLGLYAPNIEAVSLSGALTTSREFALFPAADSTVSLLAEAGISLGLISQMDSSPQGLPSVSSPATTGQIIVDAIRGLTGGDTVLVAHADTPVHAESSAVTRIVSRSGDIIAPASAQLRSFFATPMRMSAGGDIVDLSLIMQHDDAGDVSTISAGGDIRYTVSRNEQGAIVPNATLQTAVYGPGALILSAGKDINLQTSDGIVSQGNLINPHLSERGASIHAIAGLLDRTPNYESFAETYIVDSDIHSAALADYMRTLTGSAPADRTAALTWLDSLDEGARNVFLHNVLLSELRGSAEHAASADPVKNGDYRRGFAALEAMFPGSTSDGESQPDSYNGDIALYFSRIYTLDGGDIALITPGGGVNVGLAAPPESFGIRKDADLLGIVTQSGGNIGIAMGQDLQVNESRLFAINDSDIVVWSSNGDIDAGRGAKTAISAPEAVINYDRDGRPLVVFSAALAGSGIQARTSTSEFERGAVVLAAPRGVVNAGDAGIVAGDLTIAATAVLGADNIKVSGVAVGVPVDAGGLGASLAGVSAAASSASSAATVAVGGERASEDQSPAAEAALSWLEVFVVGLGDESCKPDDIECLKRQK